MLTAITPSNEDVCTDCGRHLPAKNRRYVNVDRRTLALAIAGSDKPREEIVISVMDDTTVLCEKCKIAR